MEWPGSRSILSSVVGHYLTGDPAYRDVLDEIRKVTEKLYYVLGIDDYFQSSVVVLKDSGISSRIVVVFTCAAPFFNGVIAGIAYFQTGKNEPFLLSDDIFRIDHKGPVAEIQQRYVKWLDDVMIKGLAEWRRTLV